MSRRNVGEVRSIRTTAEGDTKWTRYDAHSPVRRPLHEPIRCAAPCGGRCSHDDCVSRPARWRAAWRRWRWRRLPHRTALHRAFPPVFPLVTLLPGAGGDGSAGFVLNGIDAEDQSGHRHEAAGDLNGDGIGDLFITTRFADPGGRIDAGESYVVFGSANGFPSSFALASLLPAGGGDGSAGFVLTGIEPYDRSGFSGSTAGDLNGDGIDDLGDWRTQRVPGGRTYAGRELRRLRAQHRRGWEFSCGASSSRACSPPMEATAATVSPSTASGHTTTPASRWTPRAMSMVTASTIS